MTEAEWKERIGDLRILVVDGEPEIHDLIDYVLREIGFFKVHKAMDGNRAWRMFHDTELTYDIILCEWILPGIDGIQLLKRIRAEDPHVPFVMLSVKVTQDLVTAAKELGVSAFVGKPFTAGDLRSKVETLASRIFEIQDGAA